MSTNMDFKAYSTLMRDIAGGPIEDSEAVDQLGLNTSEENAHLLLAKDRYVMARAGRRRDKVGDLSSHWKNMKKIYENDHWDGTTPEYKSRPVLPFAFSLVESVVPRLCDTSPDIKILPRHHARDVALADQLTAAQKYLWYVNRMPEKLGEAVRLALKYGTVLFKAYWDPDFHDQDYGDVRFEVVHPQNFFPDPRAYEIEQMEFCFVVVPKPLSWFRRTFPEKGMYVRADDEARADTDDEKQNQQSREDRMAALYEYWFRDKQGNLGRMYYAGNVVLALTSGRFYKHNQFPFAKFVDYALDKEFWGIGELELVGSLNKLVNNYEAQIIDNTRLMANAQWIVDKTRSGIREADTHKINNRPGAAILVNDINAIKKEPGVAIPAHIPVHQERLIFAMEQILGIHDVVQGRRPSGVRAASAIIALQEAANLRVREKSRNLARALTQLGVQTNWLLLEFYDDERAFRQFEGEAFTVTTLNVREALAKRAVEVAGELGELAPGATPEGMSLEDLDMLVDRINYPEFDVEVHIGPAVPYSQALMYEQAKEFFQLNAIDRQALLEVTNFPNREAILARMEGREAAALEGERVGEASMRSMLPPRARQTAPMLPSRARA